MNQTSAGPIVVTDGEFADKVLRSEKPVLVDFWAEWCAPCRALGPVIESIADDFADRVTVAKVDIDANHEAAMRYGIRSIPTVVLFDKGQIVDTFIGVRPKSDYISSLKNALG
jgi:thioredoxin 1